MSDYTYDTEVNTGFAAIPNNIAEAVRTVIGGVPAVFADIGASFYNSLSPAGWELQTEDILSKMGGDPLAVYQEHPDAIQALSLIGGAVIPGIGSQKVMDAWRRGSKAVNFFTDAGRQADLARATKLMSEAQGATAEYRNLMWSMRGKSVANAAIDTLAAEVAILGTMNAHPLMEDYFEDPVNNFGISMALGTTLGAGVGLIQNAARVREAVAPVQEGVLKTLYEQIMPTAPSMTDNTIMQTNAISIKNLGNIIEKQKAAGLTELNDLTTFYADKLKKQLELEQQETFKKMASKDILDLPIEQQEEVRRLLEADERLRHAHSVRLLDAKDLMDTPTAPKIRPLKQQPEFVTLITKGKKAGEDKADDIVYFKHLNAFGKVSDIQHHGNLAAIGKTEDELVKSVSTKEAQIPHYDYSLEAAGKSSPAAQADYAKWILKLGRMDEGEFESFLSKALIASDDAPLIQAITTKLEQFPNLKASAKVKVADRAPYEAEVLDNLNVKRTAGGAPVKYQEAAERLLNNKSVEKYSLRWKNSDIDDWVDGTGVTALAKGAYAFFAKGYHAKGVTPSDRELAKKFEAIYNSPESKQLRADMLRDLADDDGKIYLYRGINAPKVFGQAPLESMAITPQKAGQFATGTHGKTMLYKVDVEDVVAAFKDVGPSGDNVEIIVRASAREAEAVLDKNGAIKFRESLKEGLKQIKPSGLEASQSDLMEFLKEAKFKTIQGLVAKGFPEDAIATRLDMPRDAVRAFLASDMTYESFEQAVQAAGLMGLKSSADVTAALSVSNRPLVLKTSLKKNLYAQPIANLNAQTLNQINDGYVSTLMMNSKSPAVRGLAEMIFKRYKEPIEMIRLQLNKINEANAGNKFLTSTDHYVRSMGNIGIVASVLGKDVTQHSNNITKAFLEPVSQFMKKISDNEAALTEFGIIANMNAGIKGWRQYKDGKLWIEVPKIDPATGKEVKVLEEVLFQGKPFQVVTEEADELLRHLDKKGAELYEMSNMRQAILGERNISNIGFWMPSFNPIGKHIAYLHDEATNVTKVIYGKSPELLEEAISTFAGEMANNPSLKIVRKGDQRWWSTLNGRLDPIHMESADITKLKSGSGQSAILMVNREILSEIAGGYEHYINQSMRNLVDLSMSDVTDALRMYSNIATADQKAQSLGFVGKIMTQKKDPAKIVHNTLLGHSDLGEYDGWKTVSNSFELSLAKASQAVGAIWQTMTKPMVRWDAKKGLSPEQMKGFDYEKYDAELFKAGVINPFQVYEREAARKYGVSRLEDLPDRSKRIVSATNSLAATMALRFADLAHPLVNLMSMPILTSLAMGKTLPQSFLGAQRGTAKVGVMQTMMEGIRAMHSPRFAHLQTKWEELGYFTPLVSEATEVIKNVRSFEKGLVPGIEKAVDSNFVQWASWTSDKSESISRKVAMNTGYMLGKRLYPELDDNALTIFARDFMDKTQGNYSAAQRPVFFQGTAGMALGLFQTYMVTMAQSIYRNIEKGDWGTLAKAAALQSGIFGTKSLPGFEFISETIGNNFSDDNYDLTTGTYRALDDDVANIMLYGAPSIISGASVYTRGTVDPKLPNVLAGIQNIAGVNMGVQAMDTIAQLGRALGEGEDAGQAMLQALSIQSLSRPIARGSELVMAALGEGGSINRAGNTVQTAEEVMALNSWIARILASRPVAEAKLREAEFRRASYDQNDRENRMEVTNALRTALRNNSATPEKVSELAEEYFRNGGSPTGWRTAYRNAVARTNTPGELTFLEELDPEDPFNHMIDGLDL